MQLVIQLMQEMIIFLAWKVLKLLLEKKYRKVRKILVALEPSKHPMLSQTMYEPRREKTGLRGFRPGPTQTGLYKLRKELEA